MAEGRDIEVTVLYSPAARETHEWQLTMPAGSTLLQALRASGLGRHVPEPEWAGLPVGVWGRKAQLDQVLRARDRVEIYRPLKIDPKLARRERFSKQGVRAAGLFARRKTAGSGEAA
jgi:putative ubiquitin-RnfH superfamily antitoxin RatB of RatAB toxin-antitoxin module